MLLVSLPFETDRHHVLLDNIQGGLLGDLPSMAQTCITDKIMASSIITAKTDSTLRALLQVVCTIGATIKSH